MSAFKYLRQISNHFENELNRVSAEIISAKKGENESDDISKKLLDLSLFTSKLRLLRAKPLSVQKSVIEQQKSDTITHYGETASWKVVEQQTVKWLTQSQAVKTLITAPNGNLEPELIERKEKIIAALKEFSHQETQLRSLESLHKARVDQLASEQQEWDRQLGELRDIRENKTIDTEDNVGPLHKKLHTVVQKMSQINWLINKIATSHTTYDWLSDPHNRLNTLKLAHDVIEIEGHVLSIFYDPPHLIKLVRNNF